MKYALLVHQSQEHFDRRNDKAAVAAGRAYGEALQAAGIFIGGAGLDSPQNATTVSVRDGNAKSMTVLMLRRKSFLPASESLTCWIWMRHWNGLRVIQQPDSPPLRCVPC
jgi:hypothetical protein